MGESSALLWNMNKSNKFLRIFFEMRAPINKFFGYKIIFLYNYDANDLGVDQYQFFFRRTDGVEFIKLVMHEGRMYTLYSSVKLI